MEIAVPDKDNKAIQWEKITSIKLLKKQHVYDLALEGYEGDGKREDERNQSGFFGHNFIANDIIAHNTYISGNVSLADNLTVGGTDFFVDASSGNVGIGTTDPGNPLHVVGIGRFAQSGQANSLIHIFSTGDYGYLDSYGNAASSGGLIFRVNDAGTEAMRILADGKVGIGTTTPLSLLEVGDADNNNQNEYNMSIGGLENSNTAKPLLSLVRGGNSGVCYGGSGAFRLKHYGTCLSNDEVTQLEIALQDANTDDLASISPIMVLQSGGNVGIGTTAPTHALNVVGDINATGSIYKDGGTALDYVFDAYFGTEDATRLKAIPDNYSIVPLDELELHLKQKRHLNRLPGSLIANPYEIGEADERLLEKVEESHIYIIQLHNRLKALESEVQTLKTNPLPKKQVPDF